MDGPALATVWFVILGVLLTGYAILDGFDLGVGALHLLVARSEEERRLSLNSIGPLWDGNEVWLVTFGGALFAAFPEAYATVFSGFYSAFMLLLGALIGRAISIELRSKRPGARWRQAWDVAFCLSSTGAALLFGVAVGNVMQGVPLDARGRYAGALLDQLGPYPLLVGLLSVSLFALHGAIYLTIKTEGELAARARRWAWRCYAAFVACLVLTSAVTLAAVPRATANLAHAPALWAIPVLNLLAVLNIPRALHRGSPGYAFFSSSCVVAALVFLLGAAQFPDLVAASPDPERSLTVYDAASSPGTLQTMLWIAGLGMPCVLAYSAAVHWTFRGKVKLDTTSY